MCLDRQGKYIFTQESFCLQGILNDINEQDTSLLTVQARSRGGVRGVSSPPLENQRSTFWNLTREIIKANNYKWLTIYLHQLLCTKPPTKWLQNLLSKGGSGGANL